MYRIVVIIFVGITFVFRVQAQEGKHSRAKKNDTLASQEIIFTPDSASMYLRGMVGKHLLWKPGSDSVINAINRLIDHYNESYNGIENRLSSIHYDPLNFREIDTLLHDTLTVRWLNDSTFILDTFDLVRDPVYIQKTVVKRIVDSVVILRDSIALAGVAKDSIVRVRDTIINKKETFYETVIDTAFLDSKNVQLYHIEQRKIVPKIIANGSKNSYHFLTNGSKLVVSESVRVIVAGKRSPLFIVPNVKVSDSLHMAVKTLMMYTNKRDSIPVYLTTLKGTDTPFWLTAEESELQRFWVKNQKNDSVSLWMGNPDKRNITMVLEDDIHVERIEKEMVEDVPFTMEMPQLNLVEIHHYDEIPVYWDLGFSSAFSLSQNYLTNWSKGGESSISSLVDIKTQATYKNDVAKTEWTSNARLKYGSVATDENDFDFRKNTDVLELDSKYNRAFRKKTDFSALLHAKSQIAEGRKYFENDSSVLISKFLNPATFTIGVGLEYKPIKKSTINFSLLSYKNTFVLDTILIPQTNHGIEQGKRAKQEMGGQLLIKNEFTFWDDMKVNNSLRLFSNYLENPQNVDVEWEVDLQKQLSLYFTVLLNFHLIYDDDIRIDKYSEGEVENGKIQKKIPQLQFKQFLGLTFLVQL